MTPGDKIYAWQEQTEEGWGIIAGMMPIPINGMLTYSLFVHRNRAIVEELFADSAYAHGEANGTPIRLVEFTMTEVVEHTRPT